MTASLSEQHTGYPYVNREISWLHFNGRVLQEAEDPTVPLFDRLKFLAIFSSNLDEFFRVRVAAIRSLLRLKDKKLKTLDFNPARLLREIHRIVTAQQERFGQILRGEILPELERHGIVLIHERQVDDQQAAFLRAYFGDQVRPQLEPVVLSEEAETFLENKGLYLVVELWRGEPNVGFDRPSYGLVRIPGGVPRFVEVPGADARHYVLFLDDVIRLQLPRLFPAYEVGAAHAVKLSRDAALHLEDEFEGDLVERIKKALSKRPTGVPTRFLYDLQMPHAMLSLLKQHLDLEDEDLVPGGRYHNLDDFFGFPQFGRTDLAAPALPPLAHPELGQYPSMWTALAEKDRFVHVPYQTYDEVLRFFDEAAQDPDVEAIWTTLYRVAPNSRVVEALSEAARRGKRVTAFVEVKARFDEEPNLTYAERMEQGGVQVLYSMPALKVHAKIALVARREEGQQRLYACLSTGNFNEKTARLYADATLLTADPRLTEEVRRIFVYLEEEDEGAADPPTFEHLLVAPFNLRERFYHLIDREVEHARAGREARIVAKMNSLEDTDMIDRLYEASQAGVTIQLIVRGICRLVPGVEGVSDTITVRSIVDRFLEHARVYVFHNDGNAAYFLASADWMKRNLSRRVEVAFPIYDDELRHDLRTIIDMQLADNTKARIIDAEQRNRYARDGSGEKVRAQIDIYRYIQQKLELTRSGALRTSVE